MTKPIENLSPADLATLQAALGGAGMSAGALVGAAQAQMASLQNAVTVLQQNSSVMPGDALADVMHFVAGTSDETYVRRKFAVGDANIAVLNLPAGLTFADAIQLGVSSVSVPAIRIGGTLTTVGVYSFKVVETLRKDVLIQDGEKWTSFAAGTRFESLITLEVIDPAQVTTVAVPSSATNATVLLETALASYRWVKLQAGTYIGNTTLTVPAGKVLQGAGRADTIFQLRNTSTADRAIKNNGTIRDFEVDCNAPARTGGAQFVHGIYMEDAANLRTTNVAVRNAGEVLGYAAHFAAGIYGERTFGATADMKNIVISRCVIYDDAYILPFGIRLEAEMIGRAEGESPYDLINWAVCYNAVYGTTKNVCEMAGPDNQYGVVADNFVYRMAGQGGFESDYGSHHIWFARNIVDGAGQGGVQSMSMVAFSNRTFPQEVAPATIKPKRGRYNMFQHNEMRNVTQVGSYLVALSEDISSLGVIWDGNKSRNISRSGDALTVIGHQVTTDYGVGVSNVRYINDDVQDVDVGLKLIGALAINDLQWSGAMVSRDRGYWKADSSTPVAAINLNGAITAPIPVFGTNEAAGTLTVSGGTYTGSSVILPATPTNAVVSGATLVMPKAARDELLAQNPAISTGNTITLHNAGDAFVARLYPVPSAPSQAAYKAFLDALDMGGVLDNTRGLWLCAPGDERHVLNMMTARYNPSKQGSITFAALQGFTPDGTTGRLSTGFNPTTAPNPIVSQNDACFWVWSLTDLAAGAQNSNDFGAGNMRIFRRTVASQGGVMAVAGASETISSLYPGLILANRTGPLAADAKIYRNGAEIATATQASTALVSTTFQIGAINTTGGAMIYGANRIFLAGVGKALTVPQIAALYNAANTLKTALGVS